jgi:spermidine synthase
MNTEEMEQVEKIQSAHGTIEIFRDRATRAVLYQVEGCRQSAADSIGTSLASYIHAIYGLLSQAKARGVLLIGGAGGTLATMLARARRKATIVDIDPLSFTLARQYFGLPDTVTCHVADGEAFLNCCTQDYDAIVVDAFRGDCIPAHLQSPGFFALVRGRLTPGGAVFVNVHVKHDFDDYADRLANTMKDRWGDARVLDALGICDRNTIVMAGRVTELRAPRLLVSPATNAGGIESELARLRFRPWKASRWDFGR